MADPLQSLKAGDGLPTSIRTWNPILAAARAHPTTATPSAGAMQPSGPEIRIATDVAVLPGQVLYVDTATEPAITPTQSESSFRKTPVLTGTTFTGTTQPKTAFVVTAAQRAGGIVAAVCSGVAAARINVTDTAHQYAAYKDGLLTFESSIDGWPIVWKETGTGEKWAYVRFASTQAGTNLPKFVQAPVGGIPGRIGLVVYSALCRVVEHNADYTHTEVFTRGTTEVRVYNPFFSVVGVRGDRIIQVTDHKDGAYVLVHDTNNDGDPLAFDPL